MLARSFLLATAIATVIPPGRAVAHDHAPPDAVLESRKSHRDGIRIASCWIRGTRSGAICNQAPTAFPKPIEAPRGEATIILETRREPERVRLRAYRSLRETGEPERPAKRLDVVPEPTERGWVLTFDLSDRHRSWYLEAKGVWPDLGFPENEQFAVWTFALEVP